MTLCTRHGRILPKSSTVGPGHGGVHRRVQGSFWASADLRGVADRSLYGRQPGPKRHIEAPVFARLEWLERFNQRRQFELISD